MPKVSFSKLNDDLETDTVIIGGGIAGLTTAYLLKKAGKKVVVLEKDEIGSQGGTTVNTTGKVTSQHHLIYSILKDRLGRQTAKLYGEANQTAIEEIEKLIRLENINCDWVREDAYVFTRNIEFVNTLKKEVEVAKQLGLPASFETKTHLPFDILGAVKFSNQANFHSGKYISAIAKKINGKGSFVFEKTEAKGIYDENPAKVTTEKYTITADDIIVATNVPTFPLIARGAYCILEYPQMSYIVAGPTDKKIKGMYISTDKNEYSILPIQKAGESLILIGGENHIPFTAFNTDKRYQKLAEYAMVRFGIKEIKYRWYARDYQAYDNVPLVGKMYPWSKHLYVITAFRKWGLTNSMVSAMILRDTILGEKNPWAGIYNPIRLSPIKNIPRVFMEYAS